MRYCVTGDTLITNSDGKLQYINDIVKNSEKDTTHDVSGEIITYKGKPATYSKFFNSGVHDTKKITLNNGAILKGTYNHPVLTWDSEELDFKWKLIGQLKVKDKVIVMSKDIYRDIPKDSGKVDLSKIEVDTLEDIINSDSLEDQVIKAYAYIIKYGNMSLYVYENNKTGADRGEFRISFPDLGTLEDYDKFRTIYTSVLLNMGIHAVASSRKDLFNIRLTSEISIFNFIKHLENLSKTPVVDLIRMNEDTKSKMPEILGDSEVVQKRPKGSFMTIPGLGKFVSRRLRINTNFSSFTAYDLLSENKNGDKLFESLLTWSKDDKAEEELKEVLNSEKLSVLSDKLFVPIKSIEKNGKEEVYSIRVDTECHSFIANGIVNHNTESRLSQFTQDTLMDELKDKPVPFSPNYDGTTTEPDYLPSKFPNLLVNGTFGIGSGYMSSIPPHNIEDVYNITKMYIENPDISVKELAKNIRPDYPTNCIITNNSELTQVYETGEGNVSIRATVEQKQDKKGRDILEITSIPYMTTTASIMDKITQLVKDDIIEGIQHVRNASDSETKIIIRIEKGYSPAVVENLLYKHTKLDSSQVVRMIAINTNKEYHTYNIKELIAEWVEFRKDTIKRIYTTKISEAMKRKVTLESLLVALSDIDWVINTIRNEKNLDLASEKIQKHFKIPEAQSNIIVNMKIKTLNSLESEKIRKELEEIDTEVSAMKQLISSDTLINQVILSEIKEVKEKHAKPRVTELLDLDTDINVEDVIEDEDFLVMFTEQGYVKRLEYKIESQRRGGKGRKIGRVRDGDVLKKMMKVSTKDHFLMFTNQGRVFDIKVWQIPEVKTVNALGKPFGSFIKLNKDENVINAINLSNEEINNPKGYITMVTKDGLAKRVKVDQFDNIPSNGLIATKLRDKDQLKNVFYYEEDEYEKYLFLATREGLGMATPLSDINILGRNTQGVIGIKLGGSDDAVISAQEFDIKDKIVTLTSDGLSKQVSGSEFTPQKRGGKGRILVRLNEGEVLKSAHISDDEEDKLVVFSDTNMVSIPIKEISVMKRPAMGVKVMDTGNVCGSMIN